MPTLMIHHRKRLVLKKLTNYARLKRRVAASVGLSHVSAINQDQDDEDDLAMPQPDDFLLEYVHLMSKEERQRLRVKYPNLPPYIFMSQKQKRAFFKSRSQQYNKKLLQVPQRKSKTKKIVKFDKVFDVRPFRENEAVIQIKKTKSFKDSYQNFHFS